MVRQIILEFRNSSKTFRSRNTNKKNSNINISTILQDKEGRTLSLNFSIEKQNYQIMNIYALTRNSEKTKFYKTLKNYIDPKQNLILGGSYTRLEYGGGHPTRQKRRKPKHNPHTRIRIPN